MQTIPDIAAQIAAHKDDFFGFWTDVLLPFLPFAEAQPYLIDTVTPEQWAELQQPLTRERVIADMADYMDFAWGKAADHRGLSAERSIAKMRAWLWLLNDTETLAYADAGAHYAQYGAPILKQICTVYQLPIPADPGLARMAAGQPCHDGCQEGCGRG